jgi:hypothetical protein
MAKAIEPPKIYAKLHGLYKKRTTIDVEVLEAELDAPVGQDSFGTFDAARGKMDEFHPPSTVQLISDRAPVWYALLN